MQLNEIYTEKGIQEFVEHLEKYGDVKNGEFAYVYTPEGKDYVYKAWTHDPGFDAYLDIVRNNKNKHFPKMLKFKELPIHLARDTGLKNTKVKILKLEKLKNTSSDISIDTIYNGRNSKLSIDNLIFYKRKTNSLLETLKSRGYIVDSAWVDFVNAVDIIGNKIIQNNLLHWDLHTYGNIMKREDNAIVLSDPMSSGVRGYSLVQYGRDNDKTIKGNPNIKNKEDDIIPYKSMKKFYSEFNKKEVIAGLSIENKKTFERITSEMNDNAPK